MIVILKIIEENILIFIVIKESELGLSRVYPVLLYVSNDRKWYPSDDHVLNMMVPDFFSVPDYPKLTSTFLIEEYLAD